MKLLTFITVSLITSIVASENCTHPKWVCMVLCCEKTQVYNVTNQFEDIPEDAKAEGHDYVHTLRETMEIIEYINCKKNSFAFCFSPYYHKDSNQSDLVMSVGVPCRRSKPTALPWRIFGTVYRILLMPFCHTIMTVYSYRKGKYICKLFTCYFGSTVIKMVVSTIAVWHKTSTQCKHRAFGLDTFVVMALYFEISSCLWQSVIGFQMWSRCKEANSPDCSNKDRRRFIYCSIYVWGIAAILTSLRYLQSDENGYAAFFKCALLAISGYNLLIFLILSVNICMVRYGVISVTNQYHFKRKLTILILRLGLVLGFPRMVLLFPWLYFESLGFPLQVAAWMEPCLIFTVFVWKPIYIFNCKSGCCGCKTTEETSNATEVVYLRTGRSE